MMNDAYTVGLLLFVFVAPGLGGYAFASWHDRKRPGPPAPWGGWFAGTALSIGLWAGLWGVAERLRDGSSYDDRVAEMAFTSCLACVLANAIAMLLLLVLWRSGAGPLAQGRQRGRGKGPQAQRPAT